MVLNIEALGPKLLRGLPVQISCPSPPFHPSGEACQLWRLLPGTHRSAILGFALAKTTQVWHPNDPGCPMTSPEKGTEGAQIEKCRAGAKARWGAGRSMASYSLGHLGLALSSVPYLLP